MHQQITLRWQWRAAFFSIFAAGLLWLTGGHWLRWLLSLTVNIIVFLSIMLSQEPLAAEVSVPVYWGSLLAMIACWAGMTGFFLGDGFFYRYIEPNTRKVVKGLVLVYTAILLAAFLVLPEIRQALSEYFSDSGAGVTGLPAGMFYGLADWLGSVRAAYLLLFILVMTLYFILSGSVISVWNKTKPRNQARIKLLNARLGRLKIVFTGLIAYIVFLAINDSAGFAMALRDYLNSPASVYVLSIILAIIGWFFLIGLLSYFPQTIKKAETLPGLGLLVKAVHGVAVGFFAMAVIGFFPGTGLHSTVNGFIAGGGSVIGFEAYATDAENAASAGDYEAATEEYGYAVAAAGSSGDLDALENLLNELEAVKGR